VTRGSRNSVKAVFAAASKPAGLAWAVPDGAATVDDGFGGKSAWLTVDPPNHWARSVLETPRASPFPT